MVSVNVLCPGGYRQCVTLAAECTLQEVLELVCAKQQLAANCHELQYQGRRLDLCSSLRASGLLNRALLELVESECVGRTGSVTVAVQLASGERRQTVASCSASLWHVLERVEAVGGLEAEVGDRLVCVFAGRQVKGRRALMDTTLLRLGVTGGRVLVRFSVEATNNFPVHVVTPLVGKRDMIESSSGTGQSDTSGSGLKSGSSEHNIVQCEPQVETGPGPMAPDRLTEEETTKEPAESLKKEDLTSRQPLEKTETALEQMRTDLSMELEKREELRETEHRVKNDVAASMSENQSSLSSPTDSDATTGAYSRGAVSASSDRQRGIGCSISVACELSDDHAVVFSVEDAAGMAEEPDDEFFAVTEEDVRRRYRELCERNAALNDAPLLTDHQRQARRDVDRLSLLAECRRCAVRVHFSDGLVLQLLVPGTATGDAVFQSVARHLRQPQAPFRLIMPGCKSRALRPDELLIDADCLPSVRLVIMASEKQASPPLLSDMARQNLTTLAVADSLVASSTKRRSKVETTGGQQRPSNTSSTATHTPKWFVMNKSKR